MDNRKNEQDRIMLKLGELWGLQPHIRLCQLISNLHGAGPQDIFYTPDKEILSVIEENIKQYESTD